MKQIRGKTSIYQKNPSRCIFLQPGYDLPERERGRMAALELSGNLYEAAFMPGMRQYTFGTALMLEAGVLPVLSNDKYKISDFIAISQAYEQPVLYRSYYGNTYEKHVPFVSDELKADLMKTARELNKKSGLTDNTLLDSIAALNESPEAWDNLWNMTEEDPQKFKGIRDRLMNIEFDENRAMAAKIFTEGAIRYDEVNRMLDKTLSDLDELKVPQATKETMKQEIEKIRKFCEERQDKVNHLITMKDWNDAVANIDRNKLASDRAKFMETLNKESKELKWKQAEPETIYITKEELREHFNKLNDTTPLHMRETNELIYMALEKAIEKDQRDGKYIHTPENPYKPLTEEELDNTSPERNPMPMMILNTITASNDEADKHEAFITYTDGAHTFCERVVADDDGCLSNVKANISINGVVADLEKEAQRDVSNEISNAEQGKEPDVEKQPEHAAPEPKQEAVLEQTRTETPSMEQDPLAGAFEDDGPSR